MAAADPALLSRVNRPRDAGDQLPAAVLQGCPRSKPQHLGLMLTRHEQAGWRVGTRVTCALPDGLAGSGNKLSLDEASATSNRELQLNSVYLGGAVTESPVPRGHTVLSHRNH